MTPLLLATHVVAAVLGGAVTYVFTVRSIRKSISGGDVKRNDPTWTGVVLITASLLVLTIGTQALIAVQEGKAARTRDRAYSACMSVWSTELVTALKRRTSAFYQVRDAEQARDRAVDDVLIVVADLREDPPAATEGELDRALREAIGARERLDVAQARADRVQAQNRYEPPSATCSR